MKYIRYFHPLQLNLWSNKSLLPFNRFVYSAVTIIIVIFDFGEHLTFNNTIFDFFVVWSITCVKEKLIISTLITGFT